MSNRACFLATTKYQIINAINIAYNLGYTSDLYIIDELYSDTENLAEKIRTSCIFDNVIVVDVKKLVHLTDNLKINHLIAYLKYKRISDFVTGGRHYDVLYFCTGSIIEEAVRWRLANQGVEVIFYEEGVASYLGIMERISNTDKLFRKLLIGKVSLQAEFKKMLYEPKLYIGNDKTNVIDIIPKIKKGSELCNFLNDIFEYNHDLDIDQQVILFDLLIEKNLNDEGRKFYSNFVNRIHDLFRHDLLVKPHPSDKTNRYKDILVYKNKLTPFEIININSVFNEKILITFFSSAALTPFLLFEEKPVVIVLYKAFKQYMKRQISEELDSFFEMAKDIYTNDRFFLPTTYEECLSILERISKGENKI